MGEGDKHPGIMGYTVLDLLNRIQQERSDKNIKLKASYIEIYNENIKDLLISDGKNYQNQIETLTLGRIQRKEYTFQESTK